MTTPDLEHILRNAPAVKPRPELLGDLQRQIVLPKTPSSRSALPFWKQWIPALSFGLLVLGCIVALGVQTSELIQLKRDNRSLEEQVASANATLEAPPNSSATSALSEAEQQEIERLRAEVDQLRQQLQAADQLRAEQAQLQEQLKAATARQRDEDPFAAFKTRSDSVACINNLKQLGLAARMCSNEHKEQLPPDIFSMHAELNTPKILVCPADSVRLPAPFLWEQWNAAQVTYEYLAGGTSEKDPAVVLARCPIHGSVVLNDGSAQMNPKLVTDNGHLRLAPGSYR